MILKVAVFSLPCAVIDGNLARGGKGWEGGSFPNEQVGGMPVVSLRGVNKGFWSHLVCSGHNATILSCPRFVMMHEVDAYNLHTTI